MRHSPLVPLLLAGSVACGVSGKTYDLTGRWDHRVWNLKETSPRYGYVCTIMGLTFSLTQSGSTISGTYSGSAQANCDPPMVLGPMSGQVVNGVVGSGNTFQFDFAPAGWHHDGSAGEDALEGTVTATLQTAGGPAEFKGSFLAVRQ